MTDMYDELIHTYSLCPSCKHECAWLGEQGVSLSLFGECYTCRFEDAPWHDEKHLGDDVARVIAERERRERVTGRRVLPCPSCGVSGVLVRDCRLCSGHGWVIGYAPSTQ